MKYILILTSNSEKTAAWKEREQYVRSFAKNIEGILQSTKVHYTTYADLRFSIFDQKPHIYDTRNERQLTDYDFVQFKNWQYEAEEAGVIAKYLDKHGIPFANNEVNSGMHLNKLSQMFTLAFDGLPVPSTVYGYPATDELKDYLEQHLGFPMIAKANDGSRGDSNYLVKDRAQLDIILNAEPQMRFIFQQFIPNKGDYRILFIGFEQGPLVFLRRGDGSSHLNNTSKGGEGTLLPYNKLPVEVRRDALAAAKLVNREISGVDIIVDSQTGKYYLLEINSTPALATGFAQDKKVNLFAQYIAKLTEEKEEE